MKLANPAAKIHLVFPMAGQGARFGYRFKPFLEIQGQTFIEAAFAPFRPFLDQVECVYFVFLKEQDIAHDVSGRLSKLFAGINFRAVVLNEATDGPAETLYQCLSRHDIHGPMIVCDCDHALDVAGLMRLPATSPETQCALPTWDLAGESLAAWSVAAIARDGRVTAISEKKMPEQGHDFRGVIGCYYFSDAQRPHRFIESHRGLVYLSDIVRDYIDGGSLVRSIPIGDALFFGDPVRLKRSTESL